MNIILENVSGRHPAASAQAPAAIQRLNLQVNAGEQVAVIGPSGAGKTTLLHLMACALRPSEGGLLVGGQNPWQLPGKALQKLRGQLFLAPQVPPLPPRQRVVTSVLAGRLPHESVAASLKSLFYPSDIALAERALAQFDLAEKLFAWVDQLSGGERQRVGLARALTSQASLLLVDEPLSALDPSRSEQAIQTLTRNASERGATLVATLHHVEMALANFPRIVGLRNGELAFDLPSAQVNTQLLHSLYAQKLDELTGPAPVEANGFAEAAAPVVVACR